MAKKTEVRPSTGHINPFGLRLQPELRARLEAAATAAGRSLNAEITERLEASFARDARQESLFDDMPMFLRRAHDDDVPVPDSPSRKAQQITHLDFLVQLSSYAAAAAKYDYLVEKSDRSEEEEADLQKIIDRWGSPPSLAQGRFEADPDLPGL